MKRDRIEICRIISYMLDHPDKNEIYPTTNAYDALEEYINKVRVETIGWAHADACTALDKGDDYRKADVPGILRRALCDLSQGGDDEQ